MYLPKSDEEQKKLIEEMRERQKDWSIWKADTFRSIFGRDRLEMLSVLFFGLGCPTSIAAHMLTQKQYYTSCKGLATLGFVCGLGAVTAPIYISGQALMWANDRGK